MVASSLLFYWFPIMCLWHYIAGLVKFWLWFYLYFCLGTLHYCLSQNSLYVIQREATASPPWTETVKLSKDKETKFFTSTYTQMIYCFMPFFLYIIIIFFFFRVVAPGKCPMRGLPKPYVLWGLPRNWPCICACSTA